MNPTRALEYARRHRRRFVGELKELVRFPSISSQPAHAPELRRCAAWLAAHLRRIGMPHVRVIRTSGHPLVYASWRGAPGRPTVLIYGHYDVVPADPIREWVTPPFQPVIRANNLYGRGACDDKGQLFAHLKALESFLNTERSLPVNVKCIFEGEEELGGNPRLDAFIARNRKALKADAVVMSDTRMAGPNQPAISYAQRGNLRLEIEVYGPKHDLHSGNFGGAIPNPLETLCKIAGSFYEADGRVAIPGFYDKVREWSAKERDYMQRMGPPDAAILRDSGAKLAWGEEGYSLYERTTIRPSLSLHGIVGGYGGPGVKMVIPAKAAAKASVRLVPDQDPREIERLFREHVARVAPAEVKVKIRTLSSSNPVLVDRNHPALRAAAFAYRKGFGTWPVFLRSGGTISVTDTFQKVLGIPTVLMGFALPDDRIHAPNEKFHLPNFFRGIETCIWYLTAAAKPGSVPLRQGTAERQSA